MKLFISDCTLMERRPELTIIAGPNGAGKSRLCPHPSAILVCFQKTKALAEWSWGRKLEAMTYQTRWFVSISTKDSQKSSRTYTCLKISTSSMASQNMGEQSPYILRKDIFTEWRTILPCGLESSLKRLLIGFPNNRYKRKRLTAGLTGGLSLCVCAYILLKRLL